MSCFYYRYVNFLIELDVSRHVFVEIMTFRFHVTKRFWIPYKLSIFAYMYVCIWFLKGLTKGNRASRLKKSSAWDIDKQ